MRRWFWTLALLALLPIASVLATPAPAHADDPPPWRISRYDLTADLEKDGRTHVTLEFDFDFNGEPGHGPRLLFPERQAVPGNKDVWRKIPVSDISASSPSGAPADVSVDRTSDGVDIKVGDPGQYVRGVQTYIVEYTVAGLPNPRAAGSDTDTLGWNVIGNQWEIPLSDISVTVNGPADVTGTECFAGGLDATTPCAANSSSGATAEFRQDRLSPGEGLTVVANYPGGTLPESVVEYERRVHLGNMFELTPVSAIGTAVVGGLGVLGITALRRRTRDQAFLDAIPGTTSDGPVGTRKDRTIPVRFTPPDERNPGLLGTLIDTRVDQRDISATIIDLAVRGHITITEQGGGEYRFDKTAPENSDRLLPHEDEVMRGLFGAGTTFHTDLARHSTAVAKRVSSHISAANDVLYRETVERGWFRSNPKTQRSMWLVAAAALAAVGAFAVWTLGAIGLGLIGAAAIACALGVAWVGQTVTARTARGTAMYEQLMGFREYIATAEADQLRWEEGEDLFSRYLPYAIMFDLTDRWTTVFEELRARGAYTVEPVWFHGYNAGYAMASFANLSSISSGVSQAISHSLSQAASHASSGSGGGFAGGVGGGIGGGGGGGW